MKSLNDFNEFDLMLIEVAKLEGCFDSWMKPEYTITSMYVWGRDISIEVKQDEHYYDTWYHTVTDNELILGLFRRIQKLEAAK